MPLTFPKQSPGDYRIEWEGARVGFIAAKTNRHMWEKVDWTAYMYIYDVEAPHSERPMAIGRNFPTLREAKAAIRQKYDGLV